MGPREAHILRGRSLLTDAARELFRELEFKSLIGEEETPLGTFESLGITPQKVTDVE